MTKSFWVSMLLLGAMLIMPLACKAPPEFELVSLDIMPPEITAGETVSITAQVKNTGGTEGVYTAILTIDEVEAERKDVAVKPGATETVTFSLVEHEAGIHQLAIGELSSSLTVKAPPEFELISLGITPPEITAGEIVSIIAQVKNTGGTEGVYTAILTVDGTEVERKDVAVAPGASETVTFSLAKHEAGTHRLAIGEFSSCLIVKAPAKFQVISISINPPEVSCGEKAIVSAYVSNIGDVCGTYTVGFVIDGVEVETKAVTVSPHALEQVMFILTTDLDGIYTIKVGELSKNLIVNKVVTYIDKIDTTPNYSSRLPGSCGPVSVSNSLMWLSKNGFPNLTIGSDGRQLNQSDLVALLYSPNYMDTGSKNGTSQSRLLDGIKKYILDRGYSYRLESQTPPSLEWVRRGIEGHGSVWLVLGWYTYDSVTDQYTRIGGHWVTLVGYGHEASSANPYYLIVHDPAFPYIGNEYIFLVWINSGTLGTTGSAVGFYKLTGVMSLKHEADFAILDGAVVLEMQP